MTKDFTKQRDWLGLAIGNSRLHWAWFKGESLHKAWDSEHFYDNFVNEQLLKEILPFSLRDRVSSLPIYIASVVSSQTALWQTYPQAKLVTLNSIPLAGIYPSLGIDRALALWGAGTILGFPCLVIDAGTALTFTGADKNLHLIGGAILPGLGLQLQSLATKTAALPEVILSEQLPERFATNTLEAIKSGVVYTLLAGIQDFLADWLKHFPDSQIALTGGDANLLFRYLKIQAPNLAREIVVDPHLIFWGMRSLLNF
ncbi:MAG: pantothenate kinase [Hydrococcus sp. RU_2_2]|nr:pantothenate kinase [Hydrococcus sp. RU_2_2]NJP20826.1 pantothenate kinase [Hydrococcus sp. CRU_1_1]